MRRVGPIWSVIQEFESYSWATTRSSKDDPDMPLKRNDHAMDAVRYICTTLATSSFDVG